MKNNFHVVLTFLIVVFLCLAAGLAFEMNKQKKNHQQEIYELKTELIETQDQLEKATWHIEMLNKENDLKE